METRSERLEKRPRAPLPRGLISGRRQAWRRALARLVAWMNQGLDLLPPGKWLHRLVRRGLVWTRVEVSMERGGTGLDGLKVALLTDLHAGSYLNDTDLLRLFERLASEEPDLVCLVGDLINTRDREILIYREPLQRLSPPLGIFAVPGNHDHFGGEDIGLWTTFLLDHGVKVLVNEGARVERRGSPLWIAGVDDLTEGRPDLPSALSGCSGEEPVLLLSHHPDIFFEAAAVGIELTLSGHTHGGQVKLADRPLIRHSAFSWHEGLFEVEGCRLYVSRGVGVTLLPIRIRAPAEIPLLTLRVPPEGG